MIILLDKPIERQGRDFKKSLRALVVTLFTSRQVLLHSTKILEEFRTQSQLFPARAQKVEAS
jgi:hypothetical protein